MKILSVVGARPQFVKAAVVSKALRETPGVSEVLVHTGQHYDLEMSDVFFEQLGLPAPDWNLEIGSGPHGAQTGSMLAKLEETLEATRPDWVLVYGDTNSTLAGALAAAKLHVPVAHVEAGLRSFDRRMPEEVNRVLTDHVSDLLFVPSAISRENLCNEGLEGRDIQFVGDVMYDAALMFGDAAEQQSSALERMNIQSGHYVLATVHRAENTDTPERLRSVVNALRELAEEMPVVLPLHPRTRARANAFGLISELEKSLILCAPVGYLDIAKLTRHARLVVTDSGGLQKEAYFHGTLSVTLRDRTEWTELVNLGWNYLIPANSPDAGRRLRQLARHTKLEPSPARPYGDGTAAKKIAAIFGEKANS